ncbi:MAG: TonB-dependent receptor, partial [Muribaculaceae bacterium]|nr:TonB-dependent receptor [Muribaculaceae bacterium]
NFGAGSIGSMNSTDGFFRNSYTGEKVDFERQGLAKMKLSWRPSEKILVENSAWVALLRQGGYPYESVETGLINHNDTCFYRRVTMVDGLTARYFGRDFSLSSITGFQYHNDDMTLDQDFMPEDYFTLSQRRHEWSLTQDFVGKGSVGSYTWLGGVYGFYRRYNMNAPVTFGNDGIERLIENNINSALPPSLGMKLLWDEREMLLDSRFHSPIWGWALYHKSEYNWRRFTFSAGLRLAFERTDLRYRSQVNTSATMYRSVPTPAGNQLVPIMTREIDLTLADAMHLTSLQLLPEFKVSYRLTPDAAVGMIVSKGYKSGGYNTQMFSDILQQEMMKSAGPAGGNAPSSDEDSYNPADVISYKPETSWNYEIDAKANIPSAGLSLEFSAFYLRCRDQQMTVFPDENSTGRMMANAGKTRSCGVELSAIYAPVSYLRFAASYGLADARFVDFNDGRHDYKDNYVPYAPQTTFLASATYRLSTPWKELTAIEPTVTCRGAGRIYWNEANSLSQPFYAQLGASVTFRTPYADIDFWGENLTGTKFNTFYFESIGHSFLQRGNPRRMGVTVRFSLSFAQ